MSNTSPRGRDLRETTVVATRHETDIEGQLRESDAQAGDDEAGARTGAVGGGLAGAAIGGVLGGDRGALTERDGPERDPVATSATGSLARSEMARGDPDGPGS